MAEPARPSYFGLRDFLWDRCAATQEAVRVLEDAQRESGRPMGGISAYAFMTDCFMTPVLVKAVQDGEAATQQLGFDIVEELLGSSDELLVGATYIRVVSRIAGTPELTEASQRLAGPLLRDALWRSTDNPLWQPVC